MDNRKGPGKMKLVDKPTLPPIEEVFEKQVSGIAATVELQIRQDSRFDTLMAIRASWLRFYPEEHGEMDISYAKALAEKVRTIHEEVLSKVKAVTLEKVTADEWENPCNSIVEFEDPQDWEDVFFQSLVMSAVQPYGEAMDNLRARMIEEAGERG